MTLMQVEVIRSQSSKRTLYALDDVFAGESPIVRALRHREERLARQDDLVARQFEKALPQCFLGFAFGVDVRRIEEVDAEVEGALDEPRGLFEIDPRAEGQPGPQGDFADPQAAAAQWACSHG